MRNKLKPIIEDINKNLEIYLGRQDTPQGSFYDVMDYSLKAGGKRLRPVLMLKTCEMCGGNPEDVMPFACAMEMIHTYSLIHDDLPSMDNDDMRRGMPTSHKKFGEANAILAGDALLNKAFEVMSSCTENPAKTLRAIATIAKSSGIEGMIGGQVLDIENGEMSLERLEYVDSLKTGAIIKSSCVVGAIFADASESEIAAVDEFATHLGIAFQIQDDILDVIGTSEELGKPIGSDEEQNRTTYVKSFGLDGARNLLMEHSKKAMDALAPFGESAAFLIKLTAYLVERTN